MKTPNEQLQFLIDELKRELDHEFAKYKNPMNIIFGIWARLDEFNQTHRLIELPTDTTTKGPSHGYEKHSSEPR